VRLGQFAQGKNSGYVHKETERLVKKHRLFLAHFRFLKKLQIFLMLQGIMPHPTKISIDILLPAPKTFGLKLA